MASRLGATFQRCKTAGEAALITYVMGGDPDAAQSKELALACIDAGADIVELGFPFSDPIADGPTIQRAAERALAAGTTLETVLEMAGQIRHVRDVPVVLMGYLNPVLSYGPSAFFARCKRMGVDAAILPDLPPEEAAEIHGLAARHDVDLIFMLAPTSTPARIQSAANAATGFIYFVSVTGVTGARTELPPDIGEKLAAIKRLSQLPVAVGFGISTPEQAAAVGREADGIVVGSAIVSRIAGMKDLSDGKAQVGDFVRSLKRSLQSPGR